MRVLVSDPVSDQGVAILREQFEVDVITKLPPEELIRIIPEYDGLLVRSETKVTAEVLDAAGTAPVLAAGGVADAHDVRALLDAGAAGAIAGTRFLLTDESRAHPEYKRRVLEADGTIRTLLFGLGWPLPHRVVANALTDRWCSPHELGPPAVRALNRVTAPLGRLMPLGRADRITALQRLDVPFYGPGLPLAGMSATLVDRSALYAGETLHRIHDVLPAAEALARLTP